MTRPTKSSDDPIVITRVFEAPRSLVFDSWVDPGQVRYWWGPKGFTNPVCEVDARPGGKLLIHMQSPDGEIYVNRGTFEEVAAPERLVLTAGALDDDEGNPRLVVQTTVTFEDLDGATRLTMQAVILRAAGEAAGAVTGMEQGWAESLDKLAEHLVSG